MSKETETEIDTFSTFSIFMAFPVILIVLPVTTEKIFYHLSHTTSILPTPVLSIALLVISHPSGLQFLHRLIQIRIPYIVSTVRHTHLEEDFY